MSLACPIVGGRTPRPSSPRRQTSKAFPGRHFGDQRRWYAQDHQPERRSQRVGSRAPHSEVHQQIRVQRRTGVATKCKSLTCFFPRPYALLLVSQMYLHTLSLLFFSKFLSSSIFLFLSNGLFTSFLTFHSSRAWVYYRWDFVVVLFFPYSFISYALKAVTAL